MDAGKSLDEASKLRASHSSLPTDSRLFVQEEIPARALEVSEHYGCSMSALALFAQLEVCANTLRFRKQGPVNLGFEVHDCEQVPGIFPATKPAPANKNRRDSRPGRENKSIWCPKAAWLEA